MPIKEVNIDLTAAGDRAVIRPLVYPVSEAFRNSITFELGARYIKDRKIWLACADLNSLKALTAMVHPSCVAPVVFTKMRELEREASGESFKPLAKVTRKFRVKPRSYQLAAFKRAVTRDYYGLCFDMGTGKTKTALDIWEQWLDDRATDTLLIVAPPTTLSLVWETEIMDQLNCWNDGRLNIEILRGLLPVRKEKLIAGMAHKGPSAFIINYELLPSMLPLFKRLLAKHRRRLTTILDESDLIKNPSSKRSRRCMSLSKISVKRLIATGTIVANDYLDLWAQFNFLSPKITGISAFPAYRARYTISDGRQITGWRNVDELKRMLALHTSCVLKDDVLDLPPKIFTRRAVTLLPQQRKIYDEMARASAVELTRLLDVGDMRKIAEETGLKLESLEGGRSMSSTLTPLTRVLRLQQITAGFIKTDEGKDLLLDNAKIPALLEIAEQTKHEGRRMAVQCIFKKEMDLVENALAAAGHKVYRLRGGINVKDRTAQIREFQKCKDPAVMICQQQVARTGISLTGATVVVRMTNWWSLRDTLQFEDRFHRQGTTESVVYIDLVAEDTFDMTVLQALMRKVSLVKLIQRQNRNSIMHMLMGRPDMSTIYSIKSQGVEDANKPRIY